MALGIRAALYALTLIGILLFGYLIVDKLIFAPIRAKTAAATAHGQTVIAGAHNDAANAAIPVITEHGNNEAKTNGDTRAHYVYITKQPGANDPVTADLWNAYASSLCMRSSAAGVSGCGGVQQPSP